MAKHRKSDHWQMMAGIFWARYSDSKTERDRNTAMMYEDKAADARSGETHNALFIDQGLRIWAGSHSTPYNPREHKLTISRPIQGE